MRHALIIGPPGIGKSTLIQRVITSLNWTVRGFHTQKESGVEEQDRGSPVYFYPLGEPRRRGKDNLLGYCGGGQPCIHREVFDALAPLVQGLTGSELLVMDEIGFMEERSPSYCKAVLSHLQGETPVLAAVKNLDIPFLRQVTSHPNCRCFHINAANREELWKEVAAFLKEGANPL